MIKLVRLDERLIHGQVAARLLKSIDVDTAVVVDDESANSKIATQALLMSVIGAGLSGRIKTSVKTADVGIRMLNDPRCEPKKIIIVVRDINILYRIANEVPGIQEINIGNYGGIVESDEPRKMIARGFSVNGSEAKIFKEIAKSGKRVYFQPTPDSELIDTEELLKKLD